MTSPALVTWRSSRLPRLDRMIAVHPETSGSRTDPVVALEWTHALVLRLASEFQGFCRDLYDDAAVAVARELAESNKRARAMILAALKVDRSLNRGSADFNNLARDFARFQIKLWDALANRHPAAASTWKKSLESLHSARNGVVHDELDKLRAVESQGWAMEVASVLRWRNLLDVIVEAMDDLLDAEISKLFGYTRWESEDGND